MPSLGQELRKEREARGLSLDDIINATRISEKYLEAVEDDRLDLLPGGFFIKGILRSYGKAVGLDGDAVIEKYIKSGLIKSVSAERRTNKEAPISSRMKRSLAGFAAVILIAMTFTAYFLMKPRRSEKTSERPETAPAEAMTFQRDPLPPPLETAPAAIEPAKERGLRLELSFHDETWIQVYADGRPALDGLKTAGEKAHVNADRELLLHTGNAGGFDFSLNGRPGRSLGRSGAVVKNVRITLENSKDYVREEGAGTE